MKVMFFLCLLFCSAIARSETSFQLGLGTSYFNPHGDGVWYQEPFAHNLQLTSASISVGAFGTTEGGSHWRAGYHYVGHYQTTAIASPSDKAYFIYKANGFKGDIGTPLAHWYGNGNMHEVYMSYLPEYKVTSNASFFVELGLAMYVATWHMQVPDWTPCTPELVCGPITPVDVSHKNNIAYTPVIGVGMRNGYNSFAVTFRKPNTHGDGWTSIADKWAVNVETRLVFK